MQRLYTRLAAPLGLTLVILWAFSAPAQPPGTRPHIGYLWLGAEGSDRATRIYASCEEGDTELNVG